MTKILAFDGATLTTGWALVEVVGNKINLVDWGAFKMKGDLHYRLLDLQQQTTQLILSTEPNIVAVEDLKFSSYVKNISSMVKVAFAIAAIHISFAACDFDDFFTVPANSVRKSWDVKSKGTLRGAINKKYLAQISQRNRPTGFKKSDEDITDAIGLAVVAASDHIKQRAKCPPEEN